MLEQLTTVSSAQKSFRVLCVFSLTAFLAWVICVYIYQGPTLTDIQRTLSKATDIIWEQAHQTQNESLDLKQKYAGEVVSTARPSQTAAIVNTSSISDHNHPRNYSNEDSRNFVLAESTKPLNRSSAAGISGTFDFCSENVSDVITRRVLSLTNGRETMQQFGNHYVYRAYYDIRQKDKPVLRILGILPDNETSIYCHVHFSRENKAMVTVKGQYSMIHPMIHPKITLHSAMLLCPLPKLPDSDPDFVILSEERCGPAVAALEVVVPHRQTMQYNFTVCLHQPLFKVEMVDLPRILEWIAVNRVFGADRFVIYYLESTKMLAETLQPMVDSGLLETHFWNFTQVWGNFDGLRGQKAIINDCIYRHMYTSSRVLLVDYDEIPTPVKHNDWSTMLSKSPCSNASSVYFINSFFYLSVEDDGDEDYDLKALVKTRRTKEFWPCRVRSKVLLNPRAVETGSVHQVSKFLSHTGSGQPHGKPGEDFCCMPTDVAYLHHYREREVGLGKKKPFETVTDERMRDFRDRIISSAKELYQLVGRDFNELLL